MDDYLSVTNPTVTGPPSVHSSRFLLVIYRFRILSKICHIQKYTYPFKYCLLPCLKNLRHMVPRVWQSYCSSQGLASSRKNAVSSWGIIQAKDVPGFLNMHDQTAVAEPASWLSILGSSNSDPVKPCTSYGLKVFGFSWEAELAIFRWIKNS